MYQQVRYKIKNILTSALKKLYLIIIKNMLKEKPFKMSMGQKEFKQKSLNYIKNMKLIDSMMDSKKEVKKYTWL